MEKRKNKTRLARAAMTLLFALLATVGAWAETVTFDFEDNQIPGDWTNDDNYPWVVVSESQGNGHTGTYCIKSGNSGESSSESSIEATFTFVGDGSISFLGGCWGEGSSTLYDKCIFYIDGVEKFSFGARDTWETYSFEVEAGEHTFKWSFTKDSSVNGTGDAFFIDDVVVDLGSVSACSKPTGLSVELTPGNGTVASLSWTENGSATAWQICLNDDETNLIDATSNPYTLENLTPEQIYTAKVRACCDAENQSSWSNVVTFTPTNAYTFTVNDGTATNEYVPFYGYYADTGTKGQFIIPASTLQNIAYGTINKLTFYVNNSTSNTTFTSSNSGISSIFEVYMGEVDNTTFDGNTLNEWTSLEKVMNAANLEVKDHMMVVTLDTPYQYMGGNLLIGFNETTSGGYAHTYWYGVTANGASLGGYGDNFSQKNFLPKTTFDYTPGEAPTCPKPTNLTAGTPDAHSVELSWTEKGEADQWQICINGEESNLIAVNENPFTLTNLDPETAYSVKVRAYCSAEDQSSWSNVVTFTTAPTCPKPTNLTAGTPDAHSVELSWTENGEATQWQICINGEESNLIAVKENPFTLTNLDPETAYSVKVRAYCSAEDQSSWSDAVTFTTAPTCPKPTNLVAGSIGAHSAVLSWTEKGEADQWQICINGEESNLIAVNENPFTLTNLDPETAYSVKVRAYCSAEDQSSWSDVVTFTTGIANPAPTDVLADNVTSTSADISWTGNADVTSYNLRYRTARGFNYGFETAEPWAIDKFDPCTTYDGDNLRTYGIDGYSLPNANYVGSVIAFSDNNEWEAHSGNTMGAFMDAIPDDDAGITANDDYFITPELVIASGDHFIFWARSVTSNYGLERIKVGIYGGDGTISTYLAGSATDYVEVPVDWTKYDYDLSAYNGQTIQLAINCVSEDAFALLFDDIFVGNPNDDTWDVTLTNVTSPNELTGLTPSTDYEVQVQAVYADGSSQWVGTSFTTDVEFAAPENLEMTDISTTTATVSWTAPSATVTGYVYQYKKASAEEWSTEATITETSVELSGLDDATSYNFRVKAVYDGGSSTFAKINFMTDCDAKDLPYSYGFEDTDKLNCWSLLSANSENSLGISSYNEAYEGTNVFVFSSYNNASSYDQYLISPTLNTTSPVAVEFYYRTPQGYGSETFKMGYSTTTSEVSEFTWGDEISTNTTEWTPYTDVFPAGTKYVAIYYYSDYQYYLLVDDFSITEPESTNILFAKEGYATYYNSQKDVVLPAGMKAHVVTDGSTSLTYAGVADGDTDENVVPAGTAVLLQVEATESDQELSVYLVTPSAAAYAGTNLLFGSDEETTTTGTGGEKFYKLTYSNSDDNFGWYWGEANGAAFTSPAHKAWLALPASSAPFLGLPGWEDTTGIAPVGVDSENGEWYTLQGLKIGKKPTTKGVYIHNGRKVVIK